MKSKIYTIATVLLIAGAAFLAGRWSSPAPETPSTTENESPDTLAWTCSMHPQIRKPESGKCPICGMNLVAAGSSSQSESQERTLRMTESARALAQIETELVERRFPQAEIRLVGKLEYDETKVKSLTARFPARIDDLFVNYVGVEVNEGDHLAGVYSPELLAAQSELLSAHRFNADSSATLAAKEKLRLWDLLPEQIDDILEVGNASDHFELKAPISGVVVEKNVSEGDYVETGQKLFRIVDLSELWLQLEAYESDLAWLRFGQSVEFTVAAYPGETFDGRIAFIEPELDRETRTVSVRVNIPNADRKLKPGMFATAIVKSNVAQAGKVFAPEYAGKWISPMHPEIVKDAPGLCDICGMDLVRADDMGYVLNADAEPPLVVPASAVLRTGKRSIVYVAVPDAEQPAYEGREITLGPRAGDSFVVVSGLQESERIVSKGAFKIDSALQIEAKPSMMNPADDGTDPASTNEASPAPRHDHDHGHASEERSGLESVKAALPAYFELQAALANDDLESSRAALEDLVATAGEAGPVAQIAREMLAADSLDALRRPNFEKLSNVFIETVSAHPDDFSGEAYQMHCPMVYPDRGADWLQKDGELKNPYFGASMLRCGAVKREY